MPKSSPYVLTPKQFRKAILDVGLITKFEAESLVQLFRHRYPAIFTILKPVKPRNTIAPDA